MLKWLPFILLISKAYSQDLIEDMSKITHILSEEEVENFVLKPGPEKTIDGLFLQGLLIPQLQNEDNTCEVQPLDLKPKKIRYEVVAVTEDKPVDPTLPPQTTIIVAKFEEKENPIVTEIKNTIASKVQSGSTGEMGRFQLRQNQTAAKTIVLYQAPGTQIDIQSSLKTEETMNIDVSPVFGKTEADVVTPTIQVDVTNRISLNQEISSRVGLKSSVETFHTTGARALEQLQGTKFSLSTFRARTRLDAKLDSNVQSYTEVNFTANSVDREVRAIAGFDIKAPDDAQILVFTGYSNRRSDIGTSDPSLYGRTREAGIEYRARRGTTIFTKFKDGGDTRDRRIETGIRIPLGR